MIHVDILIVHGDVFTMAGNGSGYIGDGAVAITGNRIVETGTSESLSARYMTSRLIDATDRAVLPGLIDAHVHGGIALLRGIAQDSASWLSSIQPFINAMSLDALQAGAMLTAIEGLRAGTTCFCDNSPGIAHSLPFYEKAGVRVAASPLTSDAMPATAAGTPPEFSDEMRGFALLEVHDLIGRWNGAADGRINVQLGPRAADFCSERLLCELRDLSVKHGLRIHMHLAQDTREVEQVYWRYGVRPVELLHRLGLLDERLIAAHLICCTPEEVELAARSGVSMAFCPSSLLLCDGILPPADVFMDAGGLVALGTDETGSNNGANLFSEMKAACLGLKMKRSDASYMPTWRALRMATADGARAIGLDHEIGTLEAGKKADIILVDLNRPSLVPVMRRPVRNIVPNLVLSARGDEVCLSIIDGKIVYENGRIMRFDERASMEFIRETADEICRCANREAAETRTAPYAMTQNGEY
jgi:5-methylthioadenosine/S-adenosylhomocysteine deaminase